LFGVQMKTVRFSVFLVRHPDDAGSSFVTADRQCMKASNYGPCRVTGTTTSVNNKRYFPWPKLEDVCGY